MTAAGQGGGSDAVAVVSETPLPGIGVRYEFVARDGRRIGVVHHRSGVRELVRYEGDDPDTSRDLLRLGPEDSRTLAELLGASQVARDLAELEQGVEGLAVDRLPLAQATVSQHLKVLKDAGLIRGEIDAPRVCYCIDPATVRRLKQLITAL